MVSYNEKIESFLFLWFGSFSREKELPSLLFRRCLALAGKGGECVFGCMVCANQFEDRVADDIRGKVLERWLWECMKGVAVYFS